MRTRIIVFVGYDLVQLPVRVGRVDKDKIVELVIDAVGGAGNIKANGVCMTRLRLTTRDPSKVDDASLLAIPGVLGVRHRGGAGVEVVFGPRIVEDVWRAFVARTGIPRRTAGPSSPAWADGRRSPWCTVPPPPQAEGPRRWRPRPLPKGRVATRQPRTSRRRPAPREGW
ncbi:PTS transporter subunit EIIB [Atopobiaceae bacterium LCP21S3_F7]